MLICICCSHYETEKFVIFVLCLFEGVCSEGNWGNQMELAAVSPMLNWRSWNKSLLLCQDSWKVGSLCQDYVLRAY